VKPRAYLILISVAMMVTSIIVLFINQNLATELLGTTALLGALAVLLNAILDLTGNGKDE
jgi:hypothetical protein